MPYFSATFTSQNLFLNNQIKNMKSLYLLVSACLFFTLSSSAQISSVAPGGNWSNPATWSGGTIPTSSDDVIISNGSSVLIDTDGNSNNLTVDQGGILEFEEINPRGLSVKANVTINQGGIFRTSLNGNQTDHKLFISGNLTNNGTLDFSTNRNIAGGTISFRGLGTATFSGSGPVSDVLRIVVNKGTDITNMIEIKPDHLTFMDSIHRDATDAGFLYLNNGMCKISGSFPMQNGLFGLSLSYYIPATAGIWFNNPNLTVLPRNGTTYMEGTVIMDAGTFNVGTQPDNRLGYILGSKLTINGGAINVSGRFSATSTYGLTYTQTGGTFTLNTVGNTSSSYASFDMRNYDNSTFNMSGGSIVFQNASSGTAGPRDYFNDAQNVNITGGTIVFGNASSPANQTFYASGSVPNFEINSDNGGNTVKLYDDLTVMYNSTINSGSTLKLDDGAAGHIFTTRGATLTNSGAIDGSLAGSKLYFFGFRTPQTYSGNGTITGLLSSLHLNNQRGLRISNTIASEIGAQELIMESGNINTGVCTLSLGSSASSLGTFSYTTGTIIGKFKRWISASTGAKDFPVGVTAAKRNANINFTEAPTSGGTLTAEWVATPGGSNGLPLTEGSNTITTTSTEGFWRVSAADGLSGGRYTGTFNADGLSTITDFSQLVLVKRSEVAGSPWTLDGVHVPTTGSNNAAVLSRTGMSGFSEFGIGGSITSLPIAIEYFKGAKRSNTNVLDWKINCTGSSTAAITLERSSNSRDFVSVNNITATSLRCLQPFSYADNSMLTGINYYRLKVTDADGKKIYSSVIALNNNSTGFELAGIAPNPVHSKAVLSIASANNIQIELMVSDIAGRKLKRSVVGIVSGSNSISLDFSDLPAGTYQLTGATTEGITKTIQFIKN